MVQLTRADIESLPENDETTYSVAMYKNGSLVNFGTTQLHIQRRKGKYAKKGNIAVLALKSFPEWAEYSSENIAEDGGVSIEEYGLEIFRQ